MEQQEPEKQEGQIFISYARKDNEDGFAERLRDDLEKRGLHIWWDKKSMESRGKTFLQEIRDAIYESERLIAIIGPNAVESDYVRFEWEYAYNFSTVIVPILRRGDYKLIPEKFKRIFLFYDKFEKLPYELNSDELANLHCEDFQDDSRYSDALEKLTSILSKSIDPPAPFHGDKQPRMPHFYMPRYEIIEDLTRRVLIDSRIPKVPKPEDRTTALCGRGGLGKSVLAAAFARSMSARRYFQDGIFWFNIGQEGKNIRKNLKTIGTVFGDDPVKYEKLESAREWLPKILRDKIVLIVLDDVWNSHHVNIFMSLLGLRCRLLFTTRIIGVANELGVRYQRLKVLTNDEALQFLADWAGLEKKELPKEAQALIQKCDKLPLALALCGGLLRDKQPVPDVLNALNEVDRDLLKRRFPEYADSDKIIDAFTPIEVSLNVLKSRDKEDKQKKEARLRRYDHYLRLSVLPEGEQTPESVVMVLWSHKDRSNEGLLRRVARILSNRALLQLSGTWPLSLVQLHNLQRAYIRSLVRKLEVFHKDIGKALLSLWLSPDPETEPEIAKQNESYVINHLFAHLVKARCWNDLTALLADIKYLKRKQDPSEQYEFEQEIMSLMGNSTVKISALCKILKGIHDAVVNKIESEEDKADWLDTFAFWIKTFCDDAKSGGAMKPKNRAKLTEVSRMFDMSCGQVSHDLAKDRIEDGELDWGMRYLELETWVYQRAGNLEKCVEACRVAEKVCLLENMPDAYKVLGRVEFIRMRAHVLNRLLTKRFDAKKREEFKNEAEEAYNNLNNTFSKEEIWSPHIQDWKKIEKAIEEETSELPELAFNKGKKRTEAFRAKVVSNAHDCISAIKIIQFFEEEGGIVEWIHPEHFEIKDFASKDTLFTVLIGGPKAPGISKVADKFYEADKVRFLRMYSGLYCEANCLETTDEEKGTHCYMLGGISKVNTLMAAYEFTKDAEVIKIINDQE